MKIKSTSIILIIIIALGFFLRVHGINYYSYGDEAYHVYRAVGVGSGQLPNSFHSVGLFLFYLLFYIAGWIFSIFTDPNAFIGTYLSHQHVFYYAGRLFEAIMGTACLPLIYLLGRRMFSRRVGLIAALFLAVFPSAIEISQIARGQALCLFLLIISLYFSYRCLERKKVVYYLVSGLALGGAISIRLNSAIIILPALYFQYRAMKEEEGKDELWGSAGRSVPGLKNFIFHPGLWLFFLGMIIVFASSNSVALLHLPTYIKLNIAGISGVSAQQTVYLGSEVGNGWWYYLSKGFPAALSWPLYILFISGFLFSIVRIIRPNYRVLSVYSLIYILIMGKGMIASSKYLFPIFPACAFLGAGAIAWFGSVLKKRRTALLVSLVLACLVSLPPFLHILKTNRNKLMTTTKNRAEEWIFGNLSPGTRIAVESMGYYGPDLKLTPVIDYWMYNLNKEELKKLLKERLAQGQPSFALKYFIKHPPEKKFYTNTISMRDKVDISSLLEAGYEYIVITDATRQIFAKPQLKNRYPEYYNSRQKFYRWLEEDGELIKTFMPDENTPGYEIRIYKIRDKE